MRLLWDALEILDRTAISALERVDKLTKKESYFERTKKVTENVRAPQRVIQFES
jgi:hypothetical protein